MTVAGIAVGAAGMYTRESKGRCHGCFGFIQAFSLVGACVSANQSSLESDLFCFQGSGRT